MADRLRAPRCASSATIPLGDGDGIAPKLGARLTPSRSSRCSTCCSTTRAGTTTARKGRDRGARGGEEATIVAEVKRVSSRRTRQRKKMVEAGRRRHGDLNLVFFNQPWREEQLAVGTEVALYGKLDMFRGKRQLANPIVDVLARARPAHEDRRRRARSTRSRGRPTCRRGRCANRWHVTLVSIE